MSQLRKTTSISSLLWELQISQGQHCAHYECREEQVLMLPNSKSSAMGYARMAKCFLKIGYYIHNMKYKVLKITYFAVQTSRRCIWYIPCILDLGINSRTVVALHYGHFTPGKRKPGNL
jgi:hypothetical protein